MSSSLLFLWCLAWRFPPAFRRGRFPQRLLSIHRRARDLLDISYGEYQVVASPARSPVSTIVLDETRAAQRLRATISCKNSLREVTSTSAHGSENDAARFGRRGAKIARHKSSTHPCLQSLRGVAIALTARYHRCKGCTQHARASSRCLSAVKLGRDASAAPSSAGNTHTHIRGTPSTRCKTEP